MTAQVPVTVGLPPTGAIAEKHHGSGSSSSSASFAGPARQFAAARGAGGRGGTAGTAGSGATGAGAAGGGAPSSGAGGFGAAATGTGIGVTGPTLDLSNASGNIVKVQVSPSTTVTRTAKSGLSGLHIGDTLVIAGSASGGVVHDKSVRATGAGVGAGGSGFSGSGFGGFGG